MIDMCDKAAYSDVDGTLADGLHIKKFCNTLLKEGRFSWRGYKSLYGIYHDYRNGSIGYTEAAQEFVKAFARGLKGKREDDVKEATANYVKANRKTILFPFAGSLIEMLGLKGYKPVLISGSPQEIIIPLSVSLGISESDTFATAFEAEKGIYTGEVLRNMVEKGMKSSVMRSHASKYGVELGASAAFGDTESDLEMLESVRYPFAIKPNDALKKIATERGWPTCVRDGLVINSVAFYLP